MLAMAEACALKILVVDDDPDVREMTAVLLRLQGHDVETACDGVEAVSIASGFRPALILLDLQMPHMDGFAAARAIRDVDPAYGPVIVAVTGQGGLATRRQCARSGFDLHVTKPMDVQLFDAMPLLVGKRPATEEMRDLGNAMEALAATQIEMIRTLLSVAAEVRDEPIRSDCLQRAMRFHRILSEWATTQFSNPSISEELDELAGIIGSMSTYPYPDTPRPPGVA